MIIKIIPALKNIKISTLSGKTLTAKPMLNIVYTTSFKKDFKKSSKQNKNLESLKELIQKLQSRSILELKYRDHPLSGNYKGKRDCHITPDWLLVYEIDGDNLVLHRLGSHSELFRR